MRSRGNIIWASAMAVVIIAAVIAIGLLWNQKTSVAAERDQFQTDVVSLRRQLAEALATPTPTPTPVATPTPSASPRATATPAKTPTPTPVATNKSQL